MKFSSNVGSTVLCW